MSGERQESGNKAETSPEKLVSATLCAWEAAGADGTSARALAAAARLPVSSIYYHFGDLEQLLARAQSDARAGAQRWCDLQLDAIRDAPRGAGALGSLMAALIDDWCETRRTYAFAWRECHLMALRDSRHAAWSTAWDTLWLSFWEEVCTRLGLADVAMATAWLFEGVSTTHLLRWRRPVDRAALQEVCVAWGCWLDGRLAPKAPWFERARADAAALMAAAPGEDGTTGMIAAAAAATVASKGTAGLTHRAVAAEAGLTLGVVSHKFRTRADLLRAAFEAIYRRMVPQSAAELEAMPERIGRGEALERIEGGIPARQDLLATHELFSACARDTSFQAFAAQLRYLRGRSSGRYFQALIGRDRPISPVDGAIASALMGARGRAYVSGARSVTPGIATGDFDALLARLDRG